MPGRKRQGRPADGPKDRRALTGILRSALEQGSDTAALKTVMAQKVLHAMTMGVIEFPDGKKIRRVPLDADRWFQLVKFIYAHVDGPASVDVSIHNTMDAAGEQKPFTLAADLVAPAFLEAYRDISARRHTEYVFSGGRGSTKSSFVSMVMITLLKNNPLLHELVTRQVGNTLRTACSVSWYGR